MGNKRTQPAAPVVKKQAEQPVPAQVTQPPVDAPVADSAAPVLDEPVPVEAPAVPAPAPEPAPEPEPDLVNKPAPRAKVEDLAAYAARIEEEAQPLPVCQITHPDAADGGLHVGKYAGIRLVRGDAPAALLSDGTTI